MRKVLLAEDEPALLELFSEVLREMGHECVAAADGATAIALANEHRPHLVVTDYMMPERSGAEVMRAVQAHPGMEHVPVILMSAGRPPRSEQQQAWRFLPKPVDVATFEGAIREALEAVAAHTVPSPSVLPPPGSVVSPLGLAREEMLGWVSHEIKSPLSTAVSATQLAMRSLAHGDDPEKAVKLLERTMRQLKRIDELVSTLLDAAQLQDGKLQLERKPVDVVELVEAAGAYWRDTHPESVIEISLPLHAVVVEGDRERLRQIVDNLVSNALKYGQGAPIVVNVTARATSVAISISDHGRGIPPDEIPQIFDRFHRVPGEGGRGHGLGLFIAAALARLHQGAVSVESEVARGSTFSIELPLASSKV
jgi:two-component system sensor histidine kinase/response regulator